MQQRREKVGQRGAACCQSKSRREGICKPIVCTRLQECEEEEEKYISTFLDVAGYVRRLRQLQAVEKESKGVSVQVGGY
jgi:hypothetical protein